jgi:hypothetical protein
MKSVLSLLLLSLLQLPAYAEQISSSRIDSLDCTAVNLLGMSKFQLRNNEVASYTNGIFAAYRLHSAGNSEQFRFAHISLSAERGNSYVSFAFPAQQLRPGAQILNGVLILNANVNPFQPVSAFGTPWANVSCTVEISKH